MIQRVLALVAVVLSAMAAAPAPPFPIPSIIAARLDHESARSVVDDLEAHGQFDAVLDRIGRGSTDWIALAPRLAPGTDGASGEGLGISLAQALPLNPVAVLRVIKPEFDPVLGFDTVCGVPFIEGTRACVRSYKRRALAALSHVRDADLQAKRDQCRTSLTAP